MSEEETKVRVEQQVQEPVEEKVEEPVEEKAKQEPKITTPAKKKEKDPKKVAQGKRLAQISERAKKEKIRREIEEENKLFDFSVNYGTLFKLGVPAVVFLGFYLYGKSKSVAKPPTPPPPQKTKNDENPQPARKHVSLFD